MRPRWKRPSLKVESVEDLRKQADIAVKVLTVFRGAALLLDEVSGAFYVQAYQRACVLQPLFCV